MAAAGVDVRSEEGWICCCCGIYEARESLRLHVVELRALTCSRAHVLCSVIKAGEALRWCEGGRGGLFGGRAAKTCPQHSGGGELDRWGIFWGEEGGRRAGQDGCTPNASAALFFDIMYYYWRGEAIGTVTSVTLRRNMRHASVPAASLTVTASLPWLHPASASERIDTSTSTMILFCLACFGVDFP